MANKKISFLSLFTLLILISISSAAGAVSLTFSLLDQPANVKHDAGSFTVSFNMTNTGTAGEVNLSYTPLSGTFTMTFPQNPISIAAGESKTITATVNFPRMQSGVIAGNVSADPIGGTASTKYASFSVPINNTPALQISEIQKLTFSQNGILNVSNPGNVILPVQMNSTGNVIVVFDTTTFTLFPGESKVIMATGANLANLPFGNHQATIVAKSGTVTTSSINWKLAKTFCRSGDTPLDSNGENINLTITKVKISNEGAGTNTDWKLLDTIKVNVRVENIGERDIKNVVVKIGMFDSSGRNKIGDLDFSGIQDSQVDIGTLGKGSDETVDFEFRVPADIDTGNYNFAVKAYSTSVGEDRLCTSQSSDLSDTIYESISIKSENKKGKYMAFENIQVMPEVLTCRETAMLSADVFNIGNANQNQVKITLTNKELGINQFYEIKSGLDIGDKSKVNFDFVIPENAKNGKYQLQLSAEYGYRNGVYRDRLDDPTLVSINIAGCSSSNGSTEKRIASISATLDNDSPKSGDKLNVNVRVTNLKDKTSDFVINVADYDSWASLESISKRTLTLPPESSATITLTFNINKGAVGEKSFIFSVISDGETEEKEIGVNIAAENQSKPGIGFNFGDNTFLWIIGAINVILIILIIIVAVRVSRR